ncbi:MAG: 50S ribosomal protein L9 [Desulfobulbaceae bacterium]|uniref:Large ribosomal subunit protein bL9 n=1 Tax=Candidatus Desulfobia pelagia TaxID=2841692 RepID=A0A8J6N8D9_9BACT|nr:50S ribosomal protein L9 [Candidatus Desulfobia pelagia]
MELILSETIDTLGEEGDIVKVKPGYGRNYLIPQGKAVIATKANLTAREQNLAVINDRKEKQRQESESLDKKIAGLTVTIAQRVGEGDKLYGSVTSADIAEKLKELGVEIDKRKILLDDTIKSLGQTIVSCKTGFQMTSDIKVEIVPLRDEE